MSFSSIPFLSQLLRFSVSMRRLAQHVAKILDAHWSMLVIGPSGHPTTFAEEIPGTHCERYGRGKRAVGVTVGQLGIALHHCITLCRSFKASHWPIHSPPVRQIRVAVLRQRFMEPGQSRDLRTRRTSSYAAMRPKKAAC